MGMMRWIIRLKFSMRLMRGGSKGIRPFNIRLVAVWASCKISGTP